MPALRSALIKLARNNKALRPHLLPLLKQGGFGGDWLLQLVKDAAVGLDLMDGPGRPRVTSDLKRAGDKWTTAVRSALAAWTAKNPTKTPLNEMMNNLAPFIIYKLMFGEVSYPRSWDFMAPQDKGQAPREFMRFMEKQLNRAQGEFTNKVWEAAHESMQGDF